MKIFEVVAGYLSRILGRRWPLIIVFLALATVWPVWFFWGELEFSATRFTELWVRTATSGIGIYVVIKIIELSRESQETKERASGRISRHRETLDYVAEFLRRLARQEFSEPGAIRQGAKRALEVWSRYGGSVPKLENISGDQGPEIRELIQAISLGQSDQTVGRFLEELARAQALGDVDIDDVGVMLQVLRRREFILRVAEDFLKVSH